MADVFSVTRSLSRGLGIIGRDLLAMNKKPKNEQPIKIKKRRATQPVPPAPSATSKQRRFQPLADQKDARIRKWCVCLRGSFGNMIYCENPNCRIKWFHMSCLNMTTVPSGDWFCAYCAK